MWVVVFVRFIVMGITRVFGLFVWVLILGWFCWCWLVLSACLRFAVTIVVGFWVLGLVCLLLWLGLVCCCFGVGFMVV